MLSSSDVYLSRLDHLRFLAALIVLVFHTVHMTVGLEYVPRYFPLSLLEEGQTGVSLFMVLSGFIFMELCHDRRVAYGPFLRNRALRVLPLFVVWLQLHLIQHPTLDHGRIALALLGLGDPARAVLGPGWTVLVEFQFYLLFPALLAAHRRQGRWFLPGLLLLAVVLRLFIRGTDGTVFRVAHATFYGRIDQFLLGMMASQLRRARPAWFRSPWLLAAAVVGWMLVWHQVNRAGLYQRVNGGPNTSWLWVVMPTVEGAAYALWTACWLSCRVTVPALLDGAIAWLGKLSYSLYLTHVLVIHACHSLARAAGLAPTGFGSALLFATAVALPLSVLLAALTYHLIELPFLQMRRPYLSDLRDEPVEAPRLAA